MLAVIIRIILPKKNDLYRYWWWRTIISKSKWMLPIAELNN